MTTTIRPEYDTCHKVMSIAQAVVMVVAGVIVMHATRSNLVASEGAFGTHLLHHDLTSESLMFGDGGAVVVEQAGIGGAPGLGLEIHTGDLVTL